MSRSDSESGEPPGEPSQPIEEDCAALSQVEETEILANVVRRSGVQEETDVTSDSDLYCDECQSSYKDQCDTHGPPSFTPDSPSPMGVPQRALLTLPPGLVIGRSSVPGAGLGVFNQGKAMPSGMYFGPLDGEETTKEKAIASRYSWMIRKSNQYLYIDATRDTHSNWMRYVNCARSEEEQNLVASQHRGGILFCCSRSILPGDELLVRHGADYAAALGGTWDQIWATKCSATDKSAEAAIQEFTCARCRLSFTAEHYLQGHILRSHPEERCRPPEATESHNPLPNGNKDQTSDCLPGQIHSETEKCSQCGQSFTDAETLRDHRCTGTGEGAHRCTHCGKGFARSCHLKRHERSIHSSEKPYCCAQCQRCFAQAAGLKRHQKTHRGETGSTEPASEVLPCSQCSLSFSEEHSLHQHTNTEHQEVLPPPEAGAEMGLSADEQEKPRSLANAVGPTAVASSGARALRSRSRSSGRPGRRQAGWGKEPRGCVSCEDGFGDPEAHRCVPSGEPALSCPECQRTFGDPESLKAHECIEVGGGLHGCCQCGLCFNRLCNLRRHERTIHTKEKPYCCSQCGKSFSQSAGLKRHQEIHARRKRRSQSAQPGAKVFPCPHCPFSFTADRYLQKHTKRYHPEEYVKLLGSEPTNHPPGNDDEGAGPHCCAPCGKRFESLRSFKSHRCFRQGEKLYLCTDCGKGFAWFNSLRQHQRIHTGEKPYRCPQCAKSFIHSGQLNVHMRTHTGEKPFLCAECGESFRQSGDLKRHERKHSGVRPCHCGECGKSFSRPQSLRAHQQLHSGEKLYTCSQCGKSFARSWHLTRHHQKMHS